MCEPLDALRATASDPPRALGVILGSGRLRERPEDFEVEETLSFEPSDDGEHLLLQVEKRDMTTLFAARLIARALGVSSRDVGFAGLKDRHAVTRQWFSVPARAAREHALEIEGLRVLAARRHRRKLRRGALECNRFRILVRGVDAQVDGVAQAAAHVRERGVPNYFGTQRFGHDVANIARAGEMFTGRGPRRSRDMRGLLLSAARAALFNHVLAHRVDDGSWCRLLDGELAVLDRSNSYFQADASDAALTARLAAFDIHPSGPMWGRGALETRAVAAALEQSVLAPFRALREGLETAGLDQERRALRVDVRSIEWRREPQVGGWFEFALPRGCYATSVLRELFVLENLGRGSGRDA